MAIRVLIADDHGVVADGLRSLIDAEADMDVVGYAPDGGDAVRKAMKTKPDVVVMDNAMPVLNGIEATSLICAQRPSTRVVMLSMYADPLHVRRALQAGAMGYVLKKSGARDVLEAIRAVHGGRRYLSATLVAGAIDQLAACTETHPLDRLSARERQVLQMLAEGHRVADIAAAISLSPKTVETYRARMMEKLGLSGLASLIRFAIRHRIVSIE